MTSRTAEQEEARNRHPDNPAQLLEKVRDHDVYRTADLTYRMFLGAHGDPNRTVDCTDTIEALAQPSWRAGKWTPPLVRLRRDGLAELTTAGAEVLAKALKRRGQKNSSRQALADRLATRARQTATPVFQAA